MILLLAGGVPDLELHQLAVDLFGFGDEGGAQGGLVELVELVVGVAEENTALAHARVAHHHAFY